MKKMARIKKLLSLLLAIYLGCLIALFIFQRDLLYFPQACTAAIQEIAPFHAYEIEGGKLRGLYAEKTTKPFTLVFFHGNADCIGNLYDVAEPYVRDGYGFLLAEYRGYSGLEGKPSEEGFYEDARAHLRYLKGRGLDESQIILFGHSLGTGVATQMATEIKASGLMLVAPFLSIGTMAQERYPVFPVNYLTLDRYDNAKKIADVGEPLLIVHGTSDGVVPYPHGQELAALAQDPKQFVTLEGAGHSDLFDRFAPHALKWLEQRKP